MNRIYIVLLALLAGTGAAWAASSNSNLLTDPGFESGTDHESFDPAWSKSGNVFHELVAARTGSWTAKLFGNFSGQLNQSEIAQEVPAQPGATYEAGVYLRHNADDQLQGQNEAMIQLELVNAEGAVLAKHASPRISAKSDTDKYKLYITGKMRAPPGTQKARVRILFVQPAEGEPGAVFCDDVSLVKSL